ncbi:hypothetical protein [Nostoc sp.]|uniref:hypothetical protein n=1 Tax=Nostoc sp. TaxID=1180 RepID=UPI002FF48B4F
MQEYTAIVRDFQEINYSNKRTTETQRTQRKEFFHQFLGIFLFGSPLVQCLRGDCRRKCIDGLCCNLGVQKTKPNLPTCIVNVAIA